MAINTSISTNVGPIDRNNSANNAIQKTDQQTSSPFQPETHVDFENSIKTTLNTLSKVTMNQGTPTQEMPKELQKMINTLMENAFSVDSSLSQGLSNLMQSQKFTVEQLNMLAKFVEQLGNLIDANEISDLPETLKTFLANLNALDGDSGKLLDSINLNKLAFQLLDGKSIADFPAALQLLLLQNPSNVNMPPQQSEGMNFLKQLIKFFLPSAAKEEGAPGQSTANQQNTTSSTPSGTANSGQGASPNQAANTNQNANASTNPGNASPSAGQTQNQGAANTASGGTQTSENLPNAQGRQGTNAAGQNSAQSGTVSTQGQTAAQSTNSAAQTKAGQNTANEAQSPQQAASGKGTVNRGQQNAANTPSQPMLQNTPAAMQLMKSLAGQMLNTSNLTEAQSDILRGFIHNGQETLSKQEAKALQTLLQVSEQNIPAYIRQAAVKQNLSDLPKLWTFVQLCNLTRLLNLPANRLKNASKTIGEFTASLRKSMRSEEKAADGQCSISFMTPLYLGENKHCYPAYIHMYHESDDENGKEQGEQQKETWLRMCLLTEHVGAVELVFRLYEQQNINLRLSFSDEAAVESFSEYIPELQSAFDAMPLNLTDIKVSAIGE